MIKHSLDQLAPNTSAETCNLYYHIVTCNYPVELTTTVYSISYFAGLIFIGVFFAEGVFLPIEYTSQPEEVGAKSFLP